MRPFATQLVGSFSKPGWLLDASRFPFNGENDGWRPAADVLPEAKNDATALAIGDQERVGLDILTDGEQRRGRFEIYCMRFDGIDSERLGKRQNAPQRDLSGSDFREFMVEIAKDPNKALVPRVTGPIRWTKPVLLDDLRFLQRRTRKPVKLPFVGPLTAACRLADEHYGDLRALANDFADAVNAEFKALESAGIDVLQIDEPDIFLRNSVGMDLAVEVLDRALHGLTVETIVHVCHGYPVTAANKRVSDAYRESLAALARTPASAISLEWEEPNYGPDVLAACGDKSVMLGVLNLGTHNIETPEHILSRVRPVLDVVPVDRLSLAPDCGMWHLPRNVSINKLRSMVFAAETLKADHGV